jgi:hypothetical protein
MVNRVGELGGTSDDAGGSFGVMLGPVADEQQASDSWRGR